MFLTVSTTVRNQHISTLNQNCVDVWWLMSPHLLQCDTSLYKQNVVTEQSENDHCLRKVSIQSKLLLINLKNRIDISVCKSKSSNISIVQNKSSTSCQLRDTYLYNTYMMIVVVVVAAALVIQESVLKYSIKKDFTYKRWWWRSWRRKKKRFEKRENHMSASNKNFIDKPYSYKAGKHMSTDNDNCTTTFSDT